MAKATLQASITQTLRASGVSGVSWAPGSGTAAGSPYYQQPPEPLPDNFTFPFVVFRVSGEGEVEHTTEAPYSEKFRVEIDVLGLETHVDTVLSPYTSGSVLRYVDSLRQTPRVLDGDNFIVTTFYRTVPWELTFEDNRGPSGERVWMASGTYLTELTVQTL